MITPAGPYETVKYTPAALPHQHSHNIRFYDCHVGKLRKSNLFDWNFVWRMARMLQLVTSIIDIDTRCTNCDACWWLVQWPCAFISCLILRTRLILSERHRKNVFLYWSLNMRSPETSILLLQLYSDHLTVAPPITITYTTVFCTRTAVHAWTNRSRRSSPCGYVPVSLNILWFAELYLFWGSCWWNKCCYIKSKHNDNVDKAVTAAADTKYINTQSSYLLNSNNYNSILL